MADECEFATSCPVDPEENQLEVDDPSILPETGTGPVEVGPPVVTGPLTPCDISYLQSNFKQLTNFTNLDDALAVANVVANSAGAAGAAGGVFAIARAVAAAAAAAGNDVATAAAAASQAVASRLVEIAGHAAVAEGAVPTEIQQRDHYGFVKSDEDSSTNVSEKITTGSRSGDPLSYSFQIMAYIESQIKTDVLGLFNELFIELYASLSAVVTNIPVIPGANPTKGFVGITRCGFLSKYTTVIYYAGRIPYNYRVEIVRLIEEYNQEIKQRIETWVFGGVGFTCKVEKSQVQYDTQKIILCIKLPTDNVIQIPILNVVGFNVFQDVTPLLRLLGCVNSPSLPCFFDPTFPGQTLSLLDIIVRVRICANQGAITALSEPSKEEVMLIHSCFQGLMLIPEAIVTAQAHQQAAMAAFGNGDNAAIAHHLDSALEAQQRAYTQQEPIVAGAALASGDAATAEHYRTIIGYQQTAITNQQNAKLAFIAGSIEHFNRYHHDATVAQQNFVQAYQNSIPQLFAYRVYTITQNIRDTLYNTEANIKAFALFCNIFYNFINVSLGDRSLAKIIYSEFFGTSDNYGKVIRTCQVVNSLPIMRENVKFFLTGSNAARVYLALNDIIKLKTITEVNLPSVIETLKKTFGNLSDNDFMIYLKGQIPRRPSSPWALDSVDPETGVSRYINSETGEVSTLEEENPENYRVFIRMILGGSFYFFKNLFDTTKNEFTLEMIQSVGIVGFMDHLFAQRFDARKEFLRRCYEKDTSFLANMLRLGHMPYFDELDKQINVAHLDGVFKYYKLVTFYTKLLNICGSFQGLTAEQLVIMYDFLINKATSIDCIATVWTLVLNVLYTLFVPENCLARIVVGKFDNDPKNLKLYMEILNDHLTDTQF